MRFPYTLPKYMFLDLIHNVGTTGMTIVSLFDGLRLGCLWQYKYDRKYQQQL